MRSDRPSPDAQDPAGRRKALRMGVGIAALMGTTGVSANYCRPRTLLASLRNEGSIESALPASFGAWTRQPDSTAVVNPQTNELVQQLYSEVVNRTYANAEGQRIMLAIAYGKDQSDEMQVHEPTVCYPSQGFVILDNQTGQLDTGLGNVTVRRLQTRYNARWEPVTYWTTIGDHVTRSGLLDKKMAKFRYSLKGQIPDGLLFRVSSIDENAERAFGLQDQFVQELLNTVSPAWRTRLAGLGAAA